MGNSLDYNEVIWFMKEFGADFINKHGEIIIHEPTNTYTSLYNCKSISDIERNTIFSLCRPIGKGLDSKIAKMLLDKVNRYFKANLTREDMLLIYTKLCYIDKLEEIGDFVKRGFPMKELREGGE